MQNAKLTRLWPFMPFSKLRASALWLAIWITANLVAHSALANVVSVSIPSSASRGIVLDGHLHQPTRAGRAPAVLLMHGCGGWQPSVKQGLDAYAEFLVAEGFVVLNLDSFGPRGNAGGTVCQSLNKLSAAREYRTIDAFDAMQFLRAQPFVDPSRVFLIGQSNGGSTAMIAAMENTRRALAGSRAGFRAVVALYPWCGATGSRRPNLSSPLLVLGGAMDDWVPPDDCARFNARGNEMRVKVYANAAHSFDVPVPVHRYRGNLVGYNPAAARDARNEILDFFLERM